MGNFRGNIVIAICCLFITYGFSQGGLDKISVNEKIGEQILFVFQYTQRHGLKEEKKTI